MPTVRGVIKLSIWAASMLKVRRSMSQKIGLHGSWSGRDGAVSRQDLIVAVKRGRSRAPTTFDTGNSEGV
jgi:hypothetical protein